MWQEVSSSNDLVRGTPYRLRLTIYSPFPASGLQGNIRAAIRKVDDTLAGITIEHLGVSFRAPDESKMFGRVGAWELIVPFQKTGAGTPIVAVIGVITAGLLAVGLLWSVANKTVEKFVLAAQDIGQRVTEPGVILAVFVLGVLFLTRGQT